LIDRREIEKLLVIHGALVSGLVDELAAGRGAHSPGDLARRLEADERAITVMLNALAAIGLAEVSQLPERFALTQLAREHLVDPGPEFERHSLLHQITKLRGWLELPHVIKHGQPPPRDRERDSRTFGRTMAEGRPEVMDLVVSRCLAYAAPHSVRKMMDVGGAVGHIALRFARRGAVAVLCDRPGMLQEAESFLEENDLRDRVQLQACDFTEALPSGGFDLAYLGNVFHIYGPETNRALSRRVFEALEPGGVIAVRDFVRDRSPRAAMFAVNMLQATHEGGVWSEAEYREWLAEAGFRDIQIEDIDLSENQLILGRKPQARG
jgi:predicted O-methyltransferase YrrM